MAKHFVTFKVRIVMAQHVIKAEVPPSDPPTEFGQHYVDTANRKVYFAVDTTDVTDWLEMKVGP